MAQRSTSRREEPSLAAGDSAPLRIAHHDRNFHKTHLGVQRDSRRKLIRNRMRADFVGRNHLCCHNGETHKRAWNHSRHDTSPYHAAW